MPVDSAIIEKQEQVVAELQKRLSTETGMPFRPDGPRAIREIAVALGIAVDKLAAYKRCQFCGRDRLTPSGSACTPPS
jgi:hypothetical protein